jgi:hypothetical protein
MSLTYTLRRWLDPAFASESEQAEQQRLQEHLPPEGVAGAGEPKRFILRVARTARRCRVCARVGEGGRFCPSCLADTLE